ncbi:circumsporozoite protein [Plasmodium cynomolgi strain B]|uniref:Circumsporozoite protein n=1 Tax=Plasmodium cynomolgi (strain B) TaxID=1120755 RepID=K6UXW2_PLACD|nr:circumsporozoite protein [Plasmodium cynomolgi strain B]GAB68634.1 circumsporozoite protein [Plasmodium cynomolgi strain B]
MKGAANDEDPVEVGNCALVGGNELGSSFLCVGCSGEASHIDGGTANRPGEENPLTEADSDKKAHPVSVLNKVKNVKNEIDAETKPNAQISNNDTYVENPPNDNECGEGHSNTHVGDNDKPPNVGANSSGVLIPNGIGATRNGELIPNGCGATSSGERIPNGCGATNSGERIPNGCGATNSGERIPNGSGALNVEDDAPLDEGNFSADDRPEENADSTGSFMLEEDTNLSRRAYRNFHICSIFIHGTLLLMVILLIGILCHDFMKASSISQKERIMIYFCGLLLSMLGLHLCLNLYMSIVLLRQAEVSKMLKTVEAKIHVIVLVYFSMCAYIYFFEGKNYPISSTFSFTIILAIIYYFMPIFLYIILRILFIIVILVLIFVKRKSPTPKKILKKLKIMKYVEYRKYCEEEACFGSAYFTNWRELNGEGVSVPQEGVMGTREAMTTTAVEGGTGIAAPGGDNKGDNVASVEPTSNCNGDGNTISTATSCVQGSSANGSRSGSGSGRPNGGGPLSSSANDRPTRSGNSNTRSNLERHLFYDRAGRATGRGGGSSSRGGTQANDRERDDPASGNQNGRDNSNQDVPPSYDNNREVPNAIDEANGEPNKDGKSAAVFEYFQKVLKKKKNAMENENAQVHENNLEENSFHINIESSDYVCSICCVEYLNDDDICILPCNYLHYYHKELFVR